MKVYVSSIYISQNQMYQTTNTPYTIYKYDLWKEKDCPALVMWRHLSQCLTTDNTSDTRNRSRVSACPNCTSYSSFFMYPYSISLSSLLHAYIHLYLHLLFTPYLLNILITVRSCLYHVICTQSLLDCTSIQLLSTATPHTGTGKCTVNRVISSCKFSILKKSYNIN